MYIAENTANASGGKAISTRFFNIINPKPEETRTAEDIINGIRKKLGG